MASTWHVRATASRQGAGRDQWKSKNVLDLTEAYALSDLTDARALIAEHRRKAQLN
jgi:hypothetical protein